MTTALDRIIAYKHEEVRALKARRTFADFERMARSVPPPRGFGAALEAAAVSRNALICEIKRRSPSAGDILPGANPCEIAKEYETGGAACLSVLTDGPSFGGSLADFEAIRSVCTLPMLRKDFMVDPIQVAEARAHGADCILIIMSSADDALAAELYASSVELGMDVLVETHDEAELERALRLPAPLIGVNNRDLKRMVTDLTVTERLAALLPPGRHLVSESGISSVDAICRLRMTGARRFLIGEWLMKQGNRRTAAVRELVAAGSD
ncbi:indole-3-glycerol phosphate synthase TrpC [Hyphomonas sp.]|uniref:indole-3-glycerol phosphate synthase TrpC n=1 Tax=Hyphomonas sp. TaxID=87 RepID=UPI00391C0416